MARPMSSGIQLTDGDLTAQDLLGVFLPDTLAVLYAGAATVLVGL
jgi:hypothetical protein